ncbi:ABC transporter ATP-binding protein [Dendrosporobacter sp. 1207_IL3150]|uniref:ABC transporter ATP-binding protein n=1 Tax=Dendrosporobacter sp. 1207_IL3150 TaxID=3084054 RepID=UPI002FD920D2
MSDNLLDMKNISLERGNRNKVLNIDRFSLRYGELAAVIGPNGAGKSTLLQTVNLLNDAMGQISLFGQTVRQANKTQLRRRSAMVFQEPILLEGSVFDNVALALKFRGISGGDIKKLTYQALKDFRCDHLADRPARLLSGGETQRVSIARALVTNPQLLLLDEPFSALDADSSRNMIEEIRQLAKERKIAVLLVSHNFTDVLLFAERAIAMLNGCIIQDDKPEILMRRPINKDVAKLVGVDNIMPCKVSKGQDGRMIICIANSWQFIHSAEVKGEEHTCCIPGDAFLISDNEKQNDKWVRLEGIVDRVIPDIGAYRVIVKISEQIITARLPRGQVEGFIKQYNKISLAFNPDEAHIV